MDGDSGADQAHVLQAELARDVVRIGGKMGLPFIAASADVGDPAPISDADGLPLAQTLFKWIDPDLEYWKDRSFALKAGFIQASRICAEPFYYHDGHLNSWRYVPALELFSNQVEFSDFGISNAIVCPCHMPFGVLGAIIWASEDSHKNIRGVFEEYADELHLLTLKFLSSFFEKPADYDPTSLTKLTRREIQCLKQAAVGKTDKEIAGYLNVSVPTIRFHMTNAGRKLGVSGRSRAIRFATTLGYVGRSAG